MGRIEKIMEVSPERVEMRWLMPGQMVWASDGKPVEQMVPVVVPVVVMTSEITGQ